jgi:Cu(I)/Ag(I) efflux system membrane fusion protein
MKKVATKTGIAVFVALVVGLFVGHLFGRGGAGGHTEANGSESSVWSCSMHPQIQLPEPGPCPLCGMDLIPLTETDSAGLTDRQIRLSPYAQKLAEVQVTPVVRRIMAQEVRMVGKVEYDETRVKTITAWVPGRLDRLYVDYTGVSVTEGDHLVHLYSPDLIAAQEELIQVVKTSAQMGEGGVEIVRERTRALVETSREKLRLLGVTDDQIEGIEEKGKPDTHLTVYSPISGIVVRKQATEGMYVKTGTPIYEIADLSIVWVKLDAYESDLRWLHYGQEVRFETEAYSGEPFAGRIAFIDPILDPQTRTVKVRVNVPNAAGRLKPGMFVRAVVEAATIDDGRVYAPELAGMYISPMHPEIIKSGPGTCDVCGMDLVPIEEYGFATAETGREAPLVIPASAPLLTGKRAVVYLKVDHEDGIYEGREVILGPRTGDHYIVLDGLNEGDLVVYNGAFKIDSAIQILARPSMMNPVEEKVESPPLVSHDSPDAFRTQLTALFAAYFDLQEALARDRLHPAHDAAAVLKDAVDQTTPEIVHETWKEVLPALQQSIEDIHSAGDFVGARKAFEVLSNAMIAITKAGGSDAGGPIYEVYCPMAFDDQGASWLQRKPEVFNPYFGAEMQRCGKVTETYEFSR